jgi:hypothetical protein
MKKVFTALWLLFSFNVFSQTIYFVNDNSSGANNGTSWADAFTKLQDALSAAVSGDQIWVAAGTYYPDEGVGLTKGDPLLSFHLKNGVAIYGGFAGTETLLSERNVTDNVTTLSGETNFADHVVQSSSLDNTAVLDGFTITGGFASTGGFAGYIGGRAMCNLNSAPTLTNCSFTGTSAIEHGGGMYNVNSSPILTKCSFSYNTTEGYGGGMYNVNSFPILTNCSFSNNISGFDGGGMYNFNSSPRLANCSFAGNLASEPGGGMSNSGSSPVLINCSFSGNFTYSEVEGRKDIAGGIHNINNSITTLINCILWGNNSNQIFNKETSKTSVTYSIVQGGYTGTGNLNQDPLFVDAANGDLHLKAGSPAIDKGLNSANTTTVDLDGNPRIVNGIIDMGAFEFTQTEAPLVQVNAGVDQTIYLSYGPSCVTLLAQASEGTAPYKYSWSPSGVTSSSIKVCPTTTITYTVTVTDASGSTATDNVTINVIDVRCGNKGDKVLVCHKEKTLCISRNAVDAHLRHGDQLGSCSGSADLNSITDNSDASQLMKEASMHFRVLVAPNPLNTTTKLQYVLPVDGEVSIKVYDVIGREVATVVQSVQKAGVYNTGFNATDLSKGVYYYRALLTTKQKVYTQTGKLMVVK